MPSIRTTLSPRDTASLLLDAEHGIMPTGLTPFGRVGLTRPVCPLGNAVRCRPESRWGNCLPQTLAGAARDPPSMPAPVPGCKGAAPWTRSSPQEGCPARGCGEPFPAHRASTTARAPDRLMTGSRPPDPIQSYRPAFHIDADSLD